MGVGQSMIRLSTAIFLAALCHQAYGQLEAGKIVLPANYRLVAELTASPNGVREPFGFVAESQTAALIAFRGTKIKKSPLDLVTNLDIAQVPFTFVPNSGLTHRGFTTLYGQLRGPLLQALDTIKPQKHLYVTGHSFGAALAVYCALDAAVNTKFRSPTAYTLASPRAGDGAFADAFNGKVADSVRIVNEHDIIPHEPPRKIYALLQHTVWHYQHVKTKFTLSFQLGSLIRNHSHVQYFHALCRLRPDYYRKLRTKAPQFVPSAPRNK